MKLDYRNSKNARVVAAYWNKPLDRPDWYKINDLADDMTEIFIYDVVGWPYNDAGELVRTIAGMKDKHILARINSPGGDYFDGLGIANAFANHPAGVTTRIESLAASITSTIAISGKKVEAYQNTMFMIHNAWVVAMIDENSGQEMVELLKKLDVNMIDMFTKKTKTGKREMKEMMDKETWMTAKEAKEKGFIDTILESGKPVKAEFDLSVFDNLPDYLKPDHELTERDAEKALRDAGFSRHKAKAMLAGRLRADTTEEEAIQAALKTLNIIGGK